jgi:glyoxylase-like metal-dependent hydrolase (beta-lactamase superfamily II)
MNAGFGQSILKEIKTVTPKPVTTLINTHTHGDHTGSNTEFPVSIDFVAQENTKANMQKMDAFKGDKAQFLPKKTFKDKMSLFSDKDLIDLYYFGPGHTNGDTFIVFPALRAMHSGDLFAGKRWPNIDASNGGSGVAWPDTLAKAAAGIKNVDTIITGHSPVMSWADFKEFGDFNRDFLSAVRALRRGGKTAEQAAAELRMPDKYKQYEASERLKTNVQTVYNELDKQGAAK